MHTLITYYKQFGSLFAVHLLSLSTVKIRFLISLFNFFHCPTLSTVKIRFLISLFNFFHCPTLSTVKIRFLLSLSTFFQCPLVCPLGPTRTRSHTDTANITTRTQNSFQYTK